MLRAATWLAVLLLSVGAALANYVKPSAGYSDTGERSHIIKLHNFCVRGQVCIADLLFLSTLSV